MKRRVPRTLAVALCVVPFMVPAILATGAFNSSNYVLSGNEINHRNSNSYKTFIPSFPNLGNLHNRINLARDDWHQSLSNTSVNAPPDNGSSPSPTTQIVFGTVNEDTNTKLIITSPYHQRGTASFNRFGGMLINMPGSARRARACRAIGQLMGIKPLSTSTDCMDQNSVANPVVGAASVQKVREFYDPVASIGGPIEQAMPSLTRNASYAVQTSAIGHDLTKLRLTVRTLRQLQGGNVPDQIYEFTSCTSVSYSRCQIDFNFTYNSSTTLPGKYQFIVTAYNAYGHVDTDSLTFYVDFPYFGFNDGWSAPAMLGRTPADLGHDPYYGAERMGANAARMDVIQSNYVNCSTGAVKPPNPSHPEVLAYNELLDHGMEPILVLYSDCDPARTILGSRAVVLRGSRLARSGHLETLRPTTTHGLPLRRLSRIDFRTRWVSKLETRSTRPRSGAGARRTWSATSSF